MLAVSGLGNSEMPLRRGVTGSWVIGWLLGESEVSRSNCPGGVRVFRLDGGRDTLNLIMIVKMIA